MSTATPQPTDHTIDGEPIPTLDEIAAQHFTLTPWVVRTPVFDRLDFPSLEGTVVNFKFELLQSAGSFKARGAFTNLLALDEAQRNAGVTCVSGGNHAVAVAYAAMRLGISAKVVLFRSANPARVALCKAYKADIVIAENPAEAFEIVRRVEAEEGRYFVHPFNGYRTVLGTSTLGYEWATQTPDLDAVIVPIGGGGLAAGVSTALRLANPRVHVYGVEPEGADAMSRSFAANHTIKMGQMHGIADSLMAPHTEQYSYELCRRHIDRIVTVSDDALCSAMLTLFAQLKLAVEPACAAATAALLGPLRETLQGKRVGVLLCGTNTDPQTFATHIERGRKVQ
ncbi:threonine/serine dehydratase [Paraburkholderia flava]|uniref:threonine/serine dehydratase n=1 Tax=Paraburkholderia flava TaxID=2547393 RepID=UPI0010616574|nr:threonine/serine dehydratase [Paraburkholderia flava]